ncbi:probable LRR receptor-like serine/threonine-protein kinase At3g47570 [Hordeum vulgare subsp. vulgare]|uniref:Receptor kinase-like protein Xa21 n=1 Tax=Hordeum vulgare subsp. vulgare TaxID=112509 RepID=M0XP34_HORVV|nr:probable LRR receptor-like serine/threonine-protein kinase At3g47570 [Hordeum vulgare subsp. vulgare]XP_044964072.1 probable LRR receptor-like serine/threonine-protein kinase At3g47570 [Hordeum vulgare subsp. vulgare]
MAPQVFRTQSLVPPSHHALFLLYTIFMFLSSNTIVFSSAQATNKTEDDRQALLCFKSGISKDPASVLGSWRNDSLNFCGWQGVTCSTTLPIRVVSLQLRSAQLTGTLSNCTAALTSLVHLNLWNNTLSGSIPEEIDELRSLRTLMLAGNRLSGNIPLSLGTAASLRYVNLANNSLSGAIPDSLANSSSLSGIILSRNKLSGVIPANLFTSSKLVFVDLRSNALSGEIPHFQNMDALQYLDLTVNSLSGTIPASLGNVSSLRSLLLAQNDLAGSIPETLGQIPNLTMLDLSFNRFTGYVPATLYNMSSLALFSLGSNSFNGQIPSEIGNSLPNLQTLVMGGNKFRGLIPDSLTNMSKLQVLDLSSNLLTGMVPSLGFLSDLSQLLLGNNTLEAGDWAFLTSLTNCTQLLRLSVYGNILNGSLPKVVGNLSTKLERLSFGRNRISGNIPAEIGNLANLILLDMGQNMISGNIPPSVGNFSNLFILELSRNKLSGQIPSTIGYLPQLGQLHLDVNKLSGNIPASIGQCKRLAMLNLSINNLDGSIPRELLNISSLSLGLDLSNNNLTGSIPQEVGNLINLELLSVSNNKLSGELPPALGLCVTLVSLHMEGNMLSGNISESLSTLKGIQQIDLSENDLTGQVPQFLGNFRSLNYINISYNKFEGPIPTGGIFGNSTAVFLQGNTGLCETAAAIFGLPICPTTPATKKKINTRLLLIITALITIALFSIICVVVTVMKGTKTQPSENFKETMKRVSYGNILKATNWFSLVNRISSSHTASVYIGRFEFETDLVAIKVFHLSEQGSRTSFFTECEVLRNTRHRNLVQAITVCSTVDFDGGEFKAIVYEFMANGSLDMWIHPRVGSSRRLLSLGQRISIAADVASALDYMHNQLTPPLIHCDLKPDNILLDYDMTSRIGDFGSAKFLSSSSGRPEGLIGVGGTIGYIAPEYGMGCKVSTGGDVYGFGVLLLEMLTARRPTDALCGNALSLHKYVDLAFPERIAKILDPAMPSEEDEAAASLRMQNYIIPLVSIGLMCTMESPKDRPGMHDVCAKIVSMKEAFVETL